MKPYLLCLLLLLSAGCATKHIVVPVTKETKTESGVFYWLPRTVVVVDLPITKSVKKRTPFWTSAGANEQNEKQAIIDAAKIELGLEKDDLFLEANEKKSFKTGVPTITTRGESDPQQLFFVKLKGGFLKNRNFNIKLTEDGLISSAESKVEDKTLEFTMKSLESFAKIAGVALKAMALQDVSNKTRPPNLPPWAFQIIEDIKGVRTARLQLISGEKAPPNISIDALKYMVEQLDQLESQLIAHLTGVTETATKTLRFEIRPNGSDSSTPLILNLATIFDDGLTFGTHPQVANPEIPAGFAGSTGVGKIVSIQIDLYPSTQRAAFDLIDRSLKGERSYYYRVPATALATVRGGKEIVRSQLAIAQYGKVLSLPPDINSSSSVYKPTYYVNSGALQELLIQGNALDPSTVSSLATAAISVGDPIVERNKAKATANDELEQLKRQAAILEQKKKIKDLEDGLSKE